MRTLVTGAAGFIGSHLVDRLLADGCDVVGADSFSSYYEPARKRENLLNAARHERFELVETDLAHAALDDLLHDVDVVFHLAAQPGVRLSWDAGFSRYVESNVLATQRLLEACRDHPQLSRFVYASSSSVYGNSSRYPSREEDLPAPHSPYGVTKLAAEHLCHLYAENWGLSTVSLRYFTVFGPRQRPDMAIHRLVGAAAAGARFPQFGDGHQIRDFTYVGDVVSATSAAATADLVSGSVLNVAGGSSVSVRELVALVEDATGHRITIDPQPAAPGDVDRTGGSTDRARQLLGWEPRTTLAEGIAAQVGWQLGVNP